MVNCPRTTHQATCNICQKIQDNNNNMQNALFEKNEKLAKFLNIVVKI